jgi:myo-inositol-1(or 4)-monophosphatase
VHPIINIATDAARQAGKIILQNLDRLDRVRVSEKSANNFVTEVDQRAEQAIIQVIHKAYPAHCILGEESGKQENCDPEYLWIIDPLDGTTNFIHGFPHFAVSIALQYQGKLEHGVIYDPVRQEFFTASRGRGAQMNNRRLRVANEIHLAKCLLGTGFPPHAAHNPEHESVQLYNKIQPLVSGVRRTGSAALDLAYVAAGRLNGFWEMGLSAWDMAAGALLIREAGGLVTDFRGGENYLDTGNIVAGNPKVFKALLQLIHH